MNCPSCSTTRLAPIALDTALQSQSCPDCQGHWIESIQYWRWLGSRPKAKMGECVENATGIEVHDSDHARLCPECSRILIRCRVGKGLDFYIERCSECGGIWLDKNEWQALEARKLHDDIHFVFSAAWQDQVRNEEIATYREDWLLKQLGAERCTALKEMRAWIINHRHREAILAFLDDRAS